MRSEVTEHTKARRATPDTGAAERAAGRRGEARGTQAGLLADELKALMECSTHAMRTPLWVLSEYAQSLHEESRSALTADGRESLDGILSSAHRLTALVSALADLASIGRKPVCRTRVNLSALVERTVEERRQAEPQRRVRVLIEPDVTALADVELLRVAVGNLIANAFKFTQRQTAAQVEFGRSPGAGDPSYFIRDNGVGFDESLSYKLFRPFQRLHADPAFEGLGMGLACVRR